MTPVPTVGDSANGRKQHHHRPPPVVPRREDNSPSWCQERCQSLFPTWILAHRSSWCEPPQTNFSYFFFFLLSLFLDQSIWFDKSDPSLLLASFPFTSTWFRSQWKHHKNRTQNQRLLLSVTQTVQIIGILDSFCFQRLWSFERCFSTPHCFLPMLICVRQALLAMGTFFCF